MDLIYNDCNLLKRQNAFQQAELSALAKLKFDFQFCITIIAMAIFKFSLKICCQIYDLAPKQCGFTVSKNIAIIVLVNPPWPASNITVFENSKFAEAVRIPLSTIITEEIIQIIKKKVICKTIIRRFFKIVSPKYHFINSIYERKDFYITVDNLQILYSKSHLFSTLYDVKKSFENNIFIKKYIYFIVLLAKKIIL